MRRRRLFVSIGALLIGTLVADQYAAGWLLEDGTYQGRFLPPFGTLESTPVRRALEAQIAGLRKRPPTGIINVWDRDLGWTNRPGERTDGDAVYRINSIGARGAREYAPETPEGVLRLATYGDSFVYCTEVPDDQSWQVELEREDGSIEAINMGVGGYGVDQALLRFRRKGRFDAGVVVIGMSLRSISRSVSRFRAFMQPNVITMDVKPRFLHVDGELELLPIPYETRLEFLEAVQDGSARKELARFDYWAGDDPLVPRSMICRITAANKAYDRRTTRGLWHGGTKEPLTLTLLVLDQFRREALASGATEVLVLIFPFDTDLDNARGGSVVYWHQLLEGLDELGVDYVDLASELEPFEGEGGLHGETHLNARGNKIVAELLLPRLEHAR